jgi:TetR/AcrR family transcriptional regulator
MDTPASAVGPARLDTATRQAEIVSAALRLAQETSPGAITTGDLAAAVGLSQGALFRHFPSKEAVWLATMGWVREQLMCRLEQVASRASTPTEALHAVFEAHVGFVATHPGVPRVIFHELQKKADSPLKRQVRQLMEAYRQLLLSLLGAAVERGDLRPDLDRPAAATLFIGIVQGLVMQAMLTGRRTGMSTEATRVFQIYLRGIEARP